MVAMIGGETHRFGRSSISIAKAAAVPGIRRAAPGRHALPAYVAETTEKAVADFLQGG
jgi:hypothetical protein